METIKSEENSSFIILKQASSNSDFLEKLMARRIVLADKHLRVCKHKYTYPKGAEGQVASID